MERQTIAPSSKKTMNASRLDDGARNIVYPMRRYKVVSIIHCVRRSVRPSLTLNSNLITQPFTTNFIKDKMFFMMFILSNLFLKLLTQ